MIQIVAIAVTVLALGGAWWSHNNAQQEIGRAEAVAVYERQQKEAEVLNTQRALEGEAYALKLLAKAEQRNRAQAAQLAESRKARQESIDAREQVDPELKDWGATLVPQFAAVRLRERTNALAATAGHSSVPGAPGLGPVAPVADPAGSPDESWIARIRRRITGLVGSPMD